MNRQTYFESLDPGDITERIKAEDGTVVTIQHYRNAQRDRDGYAWACHTCMTFGADGEWGPWHEDFYTKYPERYSTIDRGGKLWQAQHDAEWHARDNHRGIANWSPRFPDGVERNA
ncbi:MAG: hypothetical protein JWO67_4006 [Streptosporangiaceae bacterium]|nr:hypothetical protein [Streptosporangiaceae bacterium]